MTKDYLSMVSPSPADAEHYGVPGMKWGIRKSNGGSRGVIRRGATKANVALSAGAKVIGEGEKKLIFLPQKNRNKAAAVTQTRVLAEAVSINKSPQFKGKDLKGNTRLKNSYFKKIEEAAKTIYAEELNISRAQAWGEFLGMETSETAMRISVARSRIKHSAESDREVVLELNFETNELGQIISIDIPEEFMAHADLEGDDFLAHYGVPGMKWGIRKSNASGGSKSGGKSAPKGPPPKAPANEAASQKYNRLRTQIKTHGPNSLEPDELNFVNARTEAIAKVNKMNLSSPGWLTDTSKVVLQDTTKTLMKDLAKAAVKEYIAKPLIKSAIKGS